MLGRPALERDGEPVRLQGHKTWALLALLVLEGGPVARRDLVARLSSEADDPLAATRWTLSQVRRALAPDARIVEESAGLTLEGDVHVDARDLLNGVWDDATIDGATRGDLLDGVDATASPELERWLSIQRARVATARVDAIRARAAALVRTDPLRALVLAERALRSAPYDEALHEVIVECHLARGDRERAATYVAATEQLYRGDLGLAAPARLRAAIERPSAMVPQHPEVRPDVEARALMDIATSRLAAGAWSEARDITVRAISAAAANGDRHGEVRGIISFLNVRTCQLGGGRHEWDPMLQRATMLANEVGDPKLLCDIEIERGRLSAIDGRFGTAGASLRRALAMAVEHADAPRVASACRLLGTAETEWGDHAAAEEHLRRAQEHQMLRDAATAYLARLFVRMGRLDDADRIAGMSIARLDEGEIVWAPLGVIVAGEVRLARGDLAGAEERFARALVIAKETGDVDWTVLALRGLAHVDRIDGRPERALTTLRSALEIPNAHPGCRRWCEAVVLTDLVDWEEASDPAHLRRGLELATAGPMPDLAARLLPYQRSHTPAHTLAS